VPRTGTTSAAWSLVDQHRQITLPATVRPVLVPSSYPPNLGGVEEVSRQLAIGLKAAGHEPAVITNRWPKTLPDHDRIADIPVIRRSFRVPQRSLRGVGGWLVHSASTKRGVISDARQHQCDVVNLHCVSSNARYSLATSRALGVPLVVSLHGELSGDAANIYGRSPSLRRRWRRLLDAADFVTAPSAHTLREAEHIYSRSLRGRSRIIHNGVDLELFARPRLVGGRPFVFAAGRLVQNKGFDLLIDAWERLSSTFADTMLVIAGDGPQRAELERRIAASPSADRMYLVGALTRQDVADRMRAASAFVLPSRAEALGLVVLEAMAAGAPVVAADVGGVPELVQDRVNGLLFKSGDADGLADALAASLDDESESLARSETARATAAGMSWQACTDAFIASYFDAGARR
jgi:glycogen(starch) synthase